MRPEPKFLDQAKLNLARARKKAWTILLKSNPSFEFQLDSSHWHYYMDNTLHNHILLSFKKKSMLYVGNNLYYHVLIFITFTFYIDNTMCYFGSNQHCLNRLQITTAIPITCKLPTPSPIVSYHHYHHPCTNHAIISNHYISSPFSRLESSSQTKNNVNRRRLLSNSSTTHYRDTNT